MKEDLFVNRRYLKFLNDSYPLYINHNGVLKRCLSKFISTRSFDSDDFWYRLSDIPASYAEKVLDVAISLEDIKNIKKKNADTVLDSDEVKVYVTEETLLLPIVGNLLPDDGVNAYTVVYKGGKLTLKPILVCWGCHWSELFTGQTKYGANVFCLGSDLGKELMMRFASEMIPLRDVPTYLKEEAMDGEIKRI